MQAWWSEIGRGGNKRPLYSHLFIHLFAGLCFILPCHKFFGFISSAEKTESWLLSLINLESNRGLTVSHKVLLGPPSFYPFSHPYLLLNAFWAFKILQVLLFCLFLFWKSSLFYLHFQIKHYVFHILKYKLTLLVLLSLIPHFVFLFVFCFLSYYYFWYYWIKIFVIPLLLM